jgi:hypothetical protein
MKYRVVWEHGGWRIYETLPGCYRLAIRESRTEWEDVTKADVNVLQAFLRALVESGCAALNSGR